MHIGRTIQSVYSLANIIINYNKKRSTDKTITFVNFKNKDNCIYRKSHPKILSNQRLNPKISKHDKGLDNGQTTVILCSHKKTQGRKYLGKINPIKLYITIP